MDTKNTLPVLEDNPLFVVLTLEERIMLRRSATVNTYSKHQVLYKPGQPANKVFFLLKGVVKVAVHAEKKDIIKYVVRPDSLFGESCLTGDQRLHSGNVGIVDLPVQLHWVGLRQASASRATSSWRSAARVCERGADRAAVDRPG